MSDLNPLDALAPSMGGGGARADLAEERKA